MGDWAQVQESSRLTITTDGVDCLGTPIAVSVASVANIAWPAANRAVYVPFVVNAPIVVVKLMIQNGNVASGNFDIGIYDDQGDRLVSSGSTAQSGTAVAQAVDTTDITLLPGAYYFGVVMDNTTGVIAGLGPAVGICSAAGVLSQSTAFPLPATATFAAAQNAYVPLVALTARTLI
jgi:hypothetical protein